MTQRIMYDSVNPNSVPAGGNLYAGYVDGHYTNVAALRARFPRTPIVTITVLGTAAANVCDCETGDLTPAHAALWATCEHRAGRQPTIYCNSSTRPAVEAECRKLGLVLARDYSVWEAHYDGVATLPPNTVAKQYLGDHPNGHGGTYDASIVGAYWPGVDPLPTGARYRKVTIAVIAAAKLRRVDVLTYIGRQVGRSRDELLAINADAPWRHGAIHLNDMVKVRTG